MKATDLDLSRLDRPGSVVASISYVFLQGIQYMETELNSASWTPRQVAIVTAIVLLILRVTSYKYKGVEWYALVHAVASGYLSFVAVWLSYFEAETLTGTPEPLLSITCQGPLTSLHQIVPAITMGYGIFDIVEGFKQGADFVSLFFFLPPSDLMY